MIMVRNMKLQQNVIRFGSCPETILAQSLFQADIEKVQDPVIKKWLSFMRADEGVKKMNSLIEDVRNNAVIAERERALEAARAAGASAELLRRMNEILHKDSAPVTGPTTFEQIMKDIS